MRRLVLGLLCTLCAAFPAVPGAGELYMWTDGEGNVHMTDDPSKIPPRYRSNSEASAPDSRTWNTVDLPDRTEQKSTAPSSAHASQSAGENAPELYDGLDEKAWRKLYDEAERDERHAQTCQNFRPRMKYGKAPRGMRIRVQANMCDLSASNTSCVRLLRELLPDDPVAANSLSAPQMSCNEVERAMKALLTEASRRRDALEIRASQHGVPLEWRRRR